MLITWVKKFEEAGDNRVPKLVEALVEKSKIARLRVIVAMEHAKKEVAQLEQKSKKEKEKLEKATKFLEDYWSKVQAGAFETMPLKMPARVKSSREQLQALIGKISGEEVEEEDDGYCYDWTLLETRVAENLEAELLEEPYEALEAELLEGADGSNLKHLKTIAEAQWQQPEEKSASSMKEMLQKP